MTMLCRFNLVSFSNETNSWQEGITEANETTCHDAVQWVSSLKPHGGTATLQALEVGSVSFVMLN